MPSMELNIERMRAVASAATGLLQSLANADRLLLLCQLSQGERCVSELEVLVGIYQPTLSQQLGVLRKQGLVSTRREGKRMYYTVTDAKVLHVLQTLYVLYCPNRGDAGND